MLIKVVGVLLLTILTLATCATNGPNYNQGTSHNLEKANRMKIVYKEDARMKKSMAKSRKKSTPKHKNKKVKHNKKYVK
jgi:hypothetical protein